MRMHPANEIRGAVSSELDGRSVLLGVTGSSAAYKAIDLARQLLRRGARVITLLSEKAAEFVSPTLFHWATGEKPITSLSGEVEHITLARLCAGMIVAPATLKTMAGIASGYASNAVVATAVVVNSMGKPVVIAPAMHAQLWRSPQCRKALELLKEEGYVVLPPVERDGRLVLPDPRDLARVSTAILLRGRDLEGFRILATAGAAREFIDSVRFISNPSTGRMGVEIAVEAYARGATTLLVAGHLEVSVPPWIPVVRVTSTQEMLESVLRAVKSVRPHALVMAAAPCDYKPSKRFAGKIDSRSAERIELELVRNPKIVKEVRKVYDGVLVMFAAEPVSRAEECEERARAKLEEANADAIIANPVLSESAGFAKSTNEVLVITRDGRKMVWGPEPKEVIARRILDLVKDMVRRA